MRKIYLTVYLGFIILFFVLILQYIFSKRILNNVSVRTPQIKDISYQKITAVGDILCSNQSLGKSCQEDGIAKLINFHHLFFQFIINLNFN